jgi:hypothetical protein
MEIPGVRFSKGLQELYDKCSPSVPRPDYYLVIDENGDLVYPDGYDIGAARKWWDEGGLSQKRRLDMKIIGSEFIVEMVAGEALEVGDPVCTLEYVDGSDIDDEEARLYENKPGQQPCGVCVKGGPAGSIVLVEFPDKGITPKQSVLLYTLKKRRTQRLFPIDYNREAQG